MQIYYWMMGRTNQIALSLFSDFYQSLEHYIYIIVTLMDKVICPICISIPLEPRQTDCCGNIFCLACLHSLKQNTCPICRQKLSFHESKMMIRMMKQCLKRCQHCEKQFNMLEIRRHLSICNLKTVVCKYCSLDISKENIFKHLQVEHFAQFVQQFFCNQQSIVKCTKGHPMQITKAVQSFGCSLCKQCFKEANSHFKCKACPQQRCKKCLVNKSFKLCPKGHRMRLMISIKDNQFYCDECQRDIDKNEYFINCCHCEYDIDLICFKK